MKDIQDLDKSYIVGEYAEKTCSVGDLFFCKSKICLVTVVGAGLARGLWSCKSLQTKMAAVRRTTTTPWLLLRETTRLAKYENKRSPQRCFRWCDSGGNGWWKWGKALSDGCVLGDGGDDGGHLQGCLHRQEAKDAEVAHQTHIHMERADTNF